MAEDKTEHLAPGDSFEDRIIAHLDAMEQRFFVRFVNLESMVAGVHQRLSTLEAQAEERAKETKPIWERALAEILAVGEQVKGVDARVADLADRVTVMTDDLLNVCGKQRNLETRLRDIEEVRRPR
jgi:hypothetical protein